MLIVSKVVAQLKQEVCCSLEELQANINLPACEKNKGKTARIISIFHLLLSAK